MVYLLIETSDNVIIKVDRTKIRRCKKIIEAIDGMVENNNPSLNKEDLEKLQSTYENETPVKMEKVSKSTWENIFKWCSHYKDEALSMDSFETNVNLTQWDRDFLEQLSIKALRDTLKGADYLEVARLRTQIAVVFKDKIRGQRPEQIRLIFARDEEE